MSSQDIAMLYVQRAEMSRDLRALARTCEQLHAELEHYKELLHIADITKIFNDIGPRTVYKSYFQSIYRREILDEIIVRYRETDVPGPTDRTIVLRIMMKVGLECASEDGLKTHREHITFSRGG